MPTRPGFNSITENHRAEGELPVRRYLARADSREHVPAPLAERVGCPEHGTTMFGTDLCLALALEDSKNASKLEFVDLKDSSKMDGFIQRKWSEMKCSDMPFWFFSIHIRSTSESRPANGLKMKYVFRLG